MTYGRNAMRGKGEINVFMRTKNAGHVWLDIRMPDGRAERIDFGPDRALLGGAVGQMNMGSQFKNTPDHYRWDFLNCGAIDYGMVYNWLVAFKAGGVTTSRIATARNYSLFLQNCAATAMTALNAGSPELFPLTERVWLPKDVRTICNKAFTTLAAPSSKEYYRTNKEDPYWGRGAHYKFVEGIR